MGGMKTIFTISGQMKAVTSWCHLLIFVFDEKRRIICPSQHTGTICSLMHIDVRIKANQAGRHHPYHPPAALPPCSHLFVPVLRHEYQTCPADSPSNAPQWLRVTLSLPLPQRSPFILHTSIGVSCTPIECGYSGAYWFQNQCTAQLEWGLSRLQIDKFCLEH